MSAPNIFSLVHLIYIQNRRIHVIKLSTPWRAINKKNWEWGGGGIVCVCVCVCAPEWSGDLLGLKDV